MKLVGGLYRVAAAALLVAWGYNAAAQSSRALTQKAGEAAQLIEYCTRSGVDPDHSSVRIPSFGKCRHRCSRQYFGTESGSCCNSACDYRRSLRQLSRSDGGSGIFTCITRFALTPGFGVTVNETELESLAADPRVKYITLNAMLSPPLDQSVPLIGMNNVYNRGALGTGRVVVVLDTGVQSNHEFLAGKVVAEACFSNNGVAGGNTLCPNGQDIQIGAGAALFLVANCIIDGSQSVRSW